MPPALLYLRTLWRYTNAVIIIIIIIIIIYFSSKTTHSADWLKVQLKTVVPTCDIDLLTFKCPLFDLESV